ncbi:acyltransferase [Lacticaseibacillus parakribbianus]|uniref:acyltransferase n=1 Tax=Lacticaseibacillus parakribbianus TaxID=2970927 RepID=UPI0021CB4B87|nr:acyltransferase [Lacticaseibacillus parakribbianus]
MPQSHRIFYFDALRALGCLLVVLTHVTSQFLIGPPARSYWVVTAALNNGTRAAVPLFIMISGALFLDPDRPVAFARLLRKNVLRLVVMLVAWNLIYAVAEWVRSHDWSQVTHTLLLGPFHLWFLYALIGCYLMVPLLRPITANPRLMGWALTLAAVFTVLPATAQPFLRPGSPVLALLTQFHVPTLGSYVFYFVLGYALHRATLSRLQTWVLAAAGLVGTLGMIWLTQVASVAAGHLDQAFQANLGLWILLQATGWFSLAKAYWNRPLPRGVAFLAAVSLPVYLVHPLVLGLLQRVGLVRPGLHWLVLVYLLVLAGSLVFGAVYHWGQKQLHRQGTPVKS